MGGRAALDELVTIRGELSACPRAGGGILDAYLSIARRCCAVDARGLLHEEYARTLYYDALHFGAATWVDVLQLRWYDERQVGDPRRE